MKKYLIYLFTLASTLLIGCDSFRDMSGTAEVNPITVDVYLDITVENISTLKDLTVKFDNYDEDLHYVKEVTDNSVKVDGIIPGIYSVTVSGTAIDTENNEYYINGNSVNAALFKHGSALNIEVQGLKVSPLIFKEIYYCGSRPEKGGVYFRDQFYEIYNNSADILYLDGQLLLFHASLEIVEENPKNGQHGNLPGCRSGIYRSIIPVPKERKL